METAGEAGLAAVEDFVPVLKSCNPAVILHVMEGFAEGKIGALPAGQSGILWQAAALVAKKNCKFELLRELVAAKGLELFDGLGLSRHFEGEKAWDGALAASLASDFNRVYSLCDESPRLRILSFRALAGELCPKIIAAGPERTESEASALAAFMEGKFVAMREAKDEMAALLAPLEKALFGAHAGGGAGARKPGI